MLARCCSRGRLGLADVWYAGLLSALLGSHWWYGATAIASLAVGGYLLITRAETVPFIPFLASGGAVMLALSFFN
jgi:prepilin signal peptidase PulO-like enzyme (type II secretory pathway)